jgi:ATP-dependent DNA helicase DinG
MIGLNDDSAPGAGTGPKPSRVRELVEELFGETGVLCDALNLEHRPEQEQMASVTAGALYRDEPLLFEAGTGVGKSLAYLIPGIIHAVDQGRQLIVSTHTISLQEQIEQKDLPICRRVFKAAPDSPAMPTSARRARRQVELSLPHPAGHALADRGSLVADAEFDELQRIAAWAKEPPRTGLRHELKPPPARDLGPVNADSSGLLPQALRLRKCFYPARPRPDPRRQVVIVNHALLFALINAGGGRRKDRPTPAA